MGINRVDHAAILVDDIGEALEWYEGVLGLTLLDRDDARAHVTCRGDHADVTLIAGGRGAGTFAVGVDGLEDLEDLERRLDQHGIDHERISDPDGPGTAELTRFPLPSGHIMEFAVASDGRTAGQTDLSWDGKTHTPTDIDHVNLLGSEAPADVAAFLTSVVGFRLTGVFELEGDVVGVWTRGGVADHDVAYMRAVRPDDRLHHIAFSMVDSNHYQALADRLADNGKRFEFGPGRHGGAIFSGTGSRSNLFAYAFDPAGNRNEFSGDMKRFADDAETVVIDVTGSVDEVINVWAKNVPESFMTIGS
jgi:catechol 2,3-dioxygenase